MVRNFPRTNRRPAGRNRTKAVAVVLVSLGLLAGISTTPPAMAGPRDKELKHKINDPGFVRASRSMSQIGG